MKVKAEEREFDYNFRRMLIFQQINSTRERKDQINMPSQLIELPWDKDKIILMEFTDEEATKLEQFILEKTRH